MPKSNLQDTFLALVFFLIAVACSKPPTAVSTIMEITSEAAPITKGANQEDTYEIVTWFSNPEPIKGERVILYGCLVKNGVYLGGNMMQATWPAYNVELGVQNCYVLVTYQKGICLIETKDLPEDDFIPITVKFVYQNATYIKETGFTLR